MDVDGPTCWLTGRADVAPEWRDRVAADYRGLVQDGPPDRYHEWVTERYGLDLSSEFAGRRLSNPWAKASGQLSMTRQQVAEDIEAGLGYVVLKTVIAEALDGARSMSAWALRESRMVTEPIMSRRKQRGWTVSWKGRGWSGTFEEYLDLLAATSEDALSSQTVIVPSVKYHLPEPGETEWLVQEYHHTTRRLVEAWRGVDRLPMPLEKDFSPTLAGSGRASVRETVIEWLSRVPALIRSSVDSSRVVVGLKIFNALFDDEFQLELLRSVQAAGDDEAADWLIYGNRLFDPLREFEGHRGIAYGGPDLSDRNLRVLSAFQEEVGSTIRPLAATGNINNGRMALEYALRGASSFQLHTFFQLPAEQYVLTSGSRTQKALHELYLHPENGLVVWLEHLARRWGLPRDPLRFVDIVGRGRP